MSSLLLTVVIGLVFLVLASLGLGIGRLISGRNRLVKGCGSPPEQESCSLCGKRERCKSNSKEPIVSGENSCDSQSDS